ncbi:MAG: hypothetical protein ABIK28_15530 [Planctomycetota bacterium]
MKFAVIVALFLFMVPVSGFGATYYVPDNFATIQTAINSLSVFSGDTIIVKPGTYTERINFMGKTLTVKSEQGPENTVIRGDRAGSLVMFVSGEGSDCVLEGFTLTNGEDLWGGAVYIAYSTPLIKGNIITGNYANRGAGIYCTNANAFIANNSIVSNTATATLFYEALGGGISCLNSAPSIYYNVIESNYVDEGAGGGIHCQSGTAVIKYNLINDNDVGEGNGGGICCNKCGAVLSNNTIAGNTSDFGGGIYLEDSGAKLVNDMVTRNIAIRGGGIWCQDQMLDMMNCTVAANLSLESVGGGVYCTSSSKIINSLLWSNIGDNTYGSSTPVIMYCNTQKEWAGTGNISRNPDFVNPASGNYHISRLSSCINLGTGVDAPNDDVDGNPRPIMGSIDIGADEFNGSHTLSADEFDVSASVADLVNFAIKARNSDAGRSYIMLGSVSGMTPGFALPSGQTVLPLNVDIFTVNFVFPLLNTYTFTNFMGVLNASAGASAVLHTPVMDPSVVGFYMYYAYVVGAPYDLSSNGVAVRIAP